MVLNLISQKFQNITRRILISLQHGKHGGQLYSIIYHYAEKRNMIMKFEKISGEISPELKFINDPQSNLIMIILLESFVPRSDTNPKNFEPFLNDHGFKSIIMESPAYGGYSAKSEFEIFVVCQNCNL